MHTSSLHRLGFASQFRLCAGEEGCVARTASPRIARIPLRAARLPARFARGDLASLRSQARPLPPSRIFLYLAGVEQADVVPGRVSRMGHLGLARVRSCARSRYNAARRFCRGGTGRAEPSVADLNPA